MVDHIARADELRKRAVQCRLVAKEMTSKKFEECCGKLADHYVALADMEEGFARRTTALRQATNEALLLDTLGLSSDEFISMSEQR
jgi:hypothetical protein